ncbi:MAG TPA: hypothetical protein DHW45_08490 [Candidatus Latescibacteria bacterium]|nr:hypothetical protein [Candidatus Latescibacterota bacterium]
MINRLVRKILNRRQTSSRYPVNLKVKTTIASGDDLEIVSEDLSERGVRLRFESHGLAYVLGNQDELPMEIFPEEKVPSVNVQARLIWAFTPVNGGAVSGWEFLDLKG